MTLRQGNRDLFETLYSCNKCGGICQITEETKTNGEKVMPRLRGQDEDDPEEIIKKCPYCKRQGRFKKITDRIPKGPTSPLGSMGVTGVTGLTGPSGATGIAGNYQQQYYPPHQYRRESALDVWHLYLG